jgi:hypothetical protein
MTRNNDTSDAGVVADLEKKIVKLNYAGDVSQRAKNKTKSTVDTAELLRLAKKIRETYDYNDTAIDGAR